MEKIKLYFQEAYEELINKVTWPTWAELQQSAMVVLLAAIIIAIIVVLMDMASRYTLQEFLYKILHR